GLRGVRQLHPAAATEIQLATAEHGGGAGQRGSDVGEGAVGEAGARGKCGAHERTSRPACGGHAPLGAAACGDRQKSSSAMAFLCHGIIGNVNTYFRAASWPALAHESWPASVPAICTTAWVGMDDRHGGAGIS